MVFQMNINRVSEFRCNNRSRAKVLARTVLRNNSAVRKKDTKEIKNSYIKETARTLIFNRCCTCTYSVVRI